MENSGEKIKAWALFFFVIGLISSIVIGIILMSRPSYDYNSYRSSASGTNILLGMLVIVGGSLLSWFSALLIYAYGDIAENTKAIRAYLEKAFPTDSPVAQPQSVFSTKAIEDDSINEPAPKKVTPVMAPLESNAATTGAHLGEYIKVHSSGLTLTCPLCLEKQPSNRETCVRCGAIFEHVE